MAMLNNQRVSVFFKCQDDYRFTVSPTQLRISNFTKHHLGYLDIPSGQIHLGLVVDRPKKVARFWMIFMEKPCIVWTTLW